MQDLLDKSASQIAAKKGKEASSRFKRNVTLLKNSVPDTYKLYTENYNYIGALYPTQVMLEIPDGCKFTLKRLQANRILSSTAIKDIKKQVIKEKKMMKTQM